MAWSSVSVVNHVFCYRGLTFLQITFVRAETRGALHKSGAAHATVRTAVLAQGVLITGSRQRLLRCAQGATFLCSCLDYWPSFLDADFDQVQDLNQMHDS